MKTQLDGGFLSDSLFKENIAANVNFDIILLQIDCLMSTWPSFSLLTLIMVLSKRAQERDGKKTAYLITINIIRKVLDLTLPCRPI